MKDILREIFDDEYNITPKRDKKQQELDEKIYEAWDKVQQAFGDEFIDSLFKLEGEREHQRSYYYFREGYRAGVRLTLEALED